MNKPALIAVLLAILIGPAAGQGPLPNGVQASAGFGVVRLHANEIVYLNVGNDTTELSHLFWDSTSPVLTGALAVKFPEGWTISANAQVATAGGSSMSDYDWINPPNGDYSFDNWTDRSEHPTNLDWYFNGSLLIGRDFAATDNVTVNLNGGAKFITTQWSAFGGDYVYSTGSPAQFRDDVGSNPAGAHAITFSQRIPAAVLGADTTIKLDKVTLELGAQGGVALGISATDHHWNRNLLFEDTFRMSLLGSLSAKGSYAVSDHLDLVLGGTVDAVFRTRGDDVEHDDRTGAITNTALEAAGTDLFAATLTLGAKGRF